MFNLKRLVLVGILFAGFVGNGIAVATSIDQGRQYLESQENASSEARPDTMQIAPICWSIIVGGGQTVYYCLPSNQSV